MNKNEYILKLVNQAFEYIEDESTSLSKTVQKCIRIARLRNDFINLWWLDWETINIENTKLSNKVIEEISPHLTNEMFKLHRELYLDSWIGERSFTLILGTKKEEKVMNVGIQEIEVDFEHHKNIVKSSHPPNGLHPVDLYFENQSASQIRALSLMRVRYCKSILSKIQSRIHDFLSQTEKQLIFGQIHSDIFEKNRSYVDLKLGELCPDALTKFVSAQKRIKEDDPESWAQSLTTCRRLLKTLADSLYPALEEPVAGIDGKKRKLTEDKYITRLWQYVFEKSKGSTSGKLLESIVNDLGNRIDKIYELTNKGVHAEVSEFEVNQCVIQTYLIAGDLLRLSEDSSAISSLDSSA